MTRSPTRLAGWREGVDAAVQQQVQAAFNLLIQQSVKGEQDALNQFVKFVNLVFGAREVACQALSDLEKARS
jgi:hypothetical protein